VESAIEAAILERSLPDGTALTETDLAAALGVSRSPVRDALKRLAHKGLVENRGRRGFAVVAMSPAQVADFYSLREVLEGLAARLAAERMDGAQAAAVGRHLDDVERQIRARAGQGYPSQEEDFHALILRGAASPQLNAAMQAIQAKTRLLRRRSGAAAGRARDALAEHRAILDAIARHDADEAEAMMRAHVRMARSTAVPAASGGAGS
jgi:DNA-binding GntR family transcriptional regulator